MRLYPGAELQHRDGIIFRNLCDAFKEVQKVIPMIFFTLFFFVTQAIQSLFPRLPDSGRGTSLFDRGTTAPGPEGDKLRLDTFPFLSSGELVEGEKFTGNSKC